MSEALDRGVDANQRFGGDGETALHRAAALNRSDMVDLLLRHRADPRIVDGQNATPLLIASYHGNPEAVRLLIEAGSPVNEPENRYQMTPLIEAAWKGHAEAVRLLLDSGADVSARTIDGKTALRKAQDEGHQSVVMLLCAANGIGPGAGQPNC